MAGRLRGLKIAGQALLGLGLGLVIAELGFSWRDDGAFPHANFYVADAELGVRLQPDATMRFQLRRNPLTTIHVNSRGYRGGEWATPGDGEVIVVGDSQVFGLGVEDDATFSAGLAGRSSRSVINAGVPTYGPREYMAVARELLSERKARTVVVVLNFVNDPFELERPNRERHAVWDGWAVRAETAPTDVTQFPGRHWLYSRSHLVFAARRWLHARGAAAAPPDGAELDAPLDFGTPSEGGWRDLVVTTKQAHEDTARAQENVASTLATSQVRLAKVDAELAAKRGELDNLVTYGEGSRLNSMTLRISRGQPGDIVEDNRSESSRSIELTAAMIREATKARQDALAELLKVEQRRGESVATGLIAAEQTLTGERQQLRDRIAAGAPPVSRPVSQFHGYVSEFKAMCAEHGAELVVVALPIDVQVDRREWAKYGVADGPDMSDSLILLEDLVVDARELGVRALDATAALRAVGPGAFLDHDIHMTASGHAGLAEALASALAGPAPTPLRLPDPGLPAGLTFVPAEESWHARDDLRVDGGFAAGCSTQLRAGWLRVMCMRRKTGDRARAVEVREGATPATMAIATGDGLSLVTPLLVGRPLTARFSLASSVWDLEVRWSEDVEQRPVLTFVEAVGVAPAAVPEVSPAVAGLCTCDAQVQARELCSRPGDGDLGRATCRPACAKLWGDPQLAETCARTFPDDCASRLACAQNDPLFAPVCPEGQVHAFASNRCFAVCDPVRTCAAGDCTAWQGGSVCL